MATLPLREGNSTELQRSQSSLNLTTTHPRLTHTHKQHVKPMTYSDEDIYDDQDDSEHPTTDFEAMKVTHTASFLP